MKTTFFSIILLAFVSLAFAGNVPEVSADPASHSVMNAITLTGTVVDFNSGEALTGVEVKVEGTSHVTYTDFDGNFEFSNVLPGTYNLIASYISYKNSLVENFKAGEEGNSVEIKLQNTK